MTSRLNNLYTKLFYLFVFIFLIFSSIQIYNTFLFSQFPDYSTRKILISNKIFTAYISDTDEKTELGLSNSESLRHDESMLFIFATPTVQHFWMKDMLYNLDIIWLDKEFEVIGFSKNADKNSYNRENPENSVLLNSPENTKYVLEVLEGTVEKEKISVGDKLILK